MARISLEVCLMLLIALSAANEIQEEIEIPEMNKDFVPFAHKSLSDFLRGLEGMCPATAEFKDFFAKLRDYIDYCFKPATPGSEDINVETSGKFEPLFRAISALNGSKNGTSFDSWRLISGLVTMEMVSLEMKKDTWKEKEITNLYVKKLSAYYNWVESISRFVKKVSEINGKSIDLTPLGFGLGQRDRNYETLFEKSENKTQEASFSLPLYLENFPKMRKDFESFAYKGMFDFVDDLESKCLASTDFKNFFANLKDFMAFFEKVDPYLFTVGDQDGFEWRVGKLFGDMSKLNGTTGEPLDSWRVVDGLLEMANVLVEIKRKGSEQITFEQKRELTWSLVKWARGMSIFVKTASEKKRVYMDLSSFEKYYDSHVLVPSKGSGKRTRKDNPNVGNV